MEGQAENRLAAVALGMPGLPSSCVCLLALLEHTSDCPDCKEALGSQFISSFHFLPSQQLFPPLQPCCASGLRRGRQIPRAHTRTCSVFHYYSRLVRSILPLSVPFSLREFSFPSYPPVLLGRSLSGDRLLRFFLVRDGNPL